MESDYVWLWKLDCLPRISARGKQCIIHRWITKKSRAPSREHATFGQPKPANVLWMTLCTELNLTFFRKLIKYFMYFRMKFTLFFRFFDSWYIIKYLLTETSGKQYVSWTISCDNFGVRTYCRWEIASRWMSLVYHTYLCFSIITHPNNSEKPLTISLYDDT